MQISNAQKFTRIVIATVAWVALLLQLYLILLNRVDSIPITLIRYFSFFTILTNLLVAMVFSIISFAGKYQWKTFFLEDANITAVTVYILVVGVVYNVILRWLWQPTGLQRLTDDLLHTLIPIAVLIYWMLFVKPFPFKWATILAWMCYPLIYCAYVLLRGVISQEYPYPFMDVTQLGYGKVLLNSIFVTLAFFVIALLLVWCGRWKRQQ